MNLKIQEENLLILHKFFKKHTLEYFIDCGTLLGAIRENGLIKGDQDADFSISKNSLEKLRDNLPELEKLGFVSFRNSDTWMAMSLLRRGEYIDIYNFFDTIPFDLGTYQFLGKSFPVPKHYNEYLDELYGNWRVPDKNGKGDGSWEKGMPAYVKKWGR